LLQPQLRERTKLSKRFGDRHNKGDNNNGPTISRTTTITRSKDMGNGTQVISCTRQSILSFVNKSDNKNRKDDWKSGENHHLSWPPLVMAEPLDNNASNNNQKTNSNCNSSLHHPCFIVIQQQEQ
jgi:hypothetical protein